MTGLEGKNVPPNSGFFISKMKKITREELARNNGKNGTPAFIAFNIKIYDVSGSFLWRNGKHQAIHEAGGDLTEALVKAPHGIEMLLRFPVIGKLNED